MQNTTTEINITQNSSESTLQDSRSSVNMINLQELFDSVAVPSKRQILQKGLAQYQTPRDFVSSIDDYMLRHEDFPDMHGNDTTVFDPQSAGGNLLSVLYRPSFRFGCDIDNRIVDPDYQFIRGKTVDVIDAIEDALPDLKFRIVNANPPFGLKWKDKDGKVWDSTEYTWNKVIQLGRCGFFICSHKTGHKLGIDKHPFVKMKWYVPNLWPDVNITALVVAWVNPDVKALPYWEAGEKWRTLAKIIREEEGTRPAYNIWLDKTDSIKTYLSTRETLKRKLTYKDLERLGNLNGAHPLTLVTEKETRRLIEELVTDGVYRVEPYAAKVIKEAVEDYHRISSPIMPPTDFEAIAYADSEERLECISEEFIDGFEAGQKYDADSQGFKWSRMLTRNKLEYDEAGNPYTSKHECIESGQDRMILVRDKWNRVHKFLAMPEINDRYQHEESIIWKVFKKPEVLTISDKFPDVVKRNLAALDMIEILGEFKYYPGQREYLAKIGVKDSALMAADTGTGKTLFCISMIVIKGAKRALIIAPQSTVRSNDNEDGTIEDGNNAAQWMQELKRFAPQLKVYQLFSMEDYENIKKGNGGVLPNGTYVTYYESWISNGARESCPANWTDEKLREIIKEEGFTLPEHQDDPKNGHASSIGKEKNGIRCIMTPSMSTMISHEFDMVLCDEAHRCAHLGANLSQILIRMQPKYKFAVTATPIPNMVTDIFPIMGWLAVPDWYKGEKRNAAFPFARSELRKFSDNFMAHERDITQEAIKRAANPRDRSRCEKVSPVLSSPARLLKLLKPTLAFISKEACNPDLVKCNITDIRVPVGEQQGQLYRWFTNRNNIPMTNPLSRARAQIAYLRAICADPSGFPTYERGGPKVVSNFNPKTLAILNLIREILARSEQVVVVCARCGQSNTLQRYLVEAGVKVSRIDSTIPASRQAYEANQFKKGSSRVLLFGMKCAVGHSFPACPNLIVGSLEYTCGSLHQALGRVYRVNSLHDAQIYCVLNGLTIEEVMFDNVSQKQDAATICLHGKRIPRDFKPVDMDEIMGEALEKFSLSGARSEADCEDQWPSIRAAFKDALDAPKNTHLAELASGSLRPESAALSA